jgi:hypothetical protein
MAKFSEPKSSSIVIMEYVVYMVVLKSRTSTFKPKVSARELPEALAAAPAT